MTEHFDALVLGSQPGGLVAAALMAQQGLRICVVGIEDRDPHAYHAHGFELPFLPTLLPDLGHASPIAEIHRKLRLETKVRRELIFNDVPFQTVLPKQRLDICVDPEGTIAELSREFPELGGAIQAFFDRLFGLDDTISSLLADPSLVPNQGFWNSILSWKKRRAWAHLAAPLQTEELMAGIPIDHPIRNILLAPLIFFGHLDTHTPSLLHATRLLARYLRGVQVFEDPIGGLDRLLVRAAIDAGAQIYRGVDVASIDVNRQRILGIHLQNPNRHLTAKHMILTSYATQHPILHPLTHKERFWRKARKSGSKTKPETSQRALIGLNLLVQRKVLPAGMGSTVLALNGRAHPRDAHDADLPLLLGVYPAVREQTANLARTQRVADSELAVLSVAIPHTGGHASENSQTLIRRVCAQLERFIPFLTEHTVAISPDISSKSSQEKTKKSGEAQQKSPWIHAQALHPLYAGKAAKHFGIGMMPIQGPLKNTWRAGHEVLPGLGIEGQYLVGEAVAGKLMRLLK